MMKLHKFNKSNSLTKLNIKRNRSKFIKIGSIVFSVLILIGAIMYFTFARFESSQSFSLVNATVGTFSNGDVKIEAVINGVMQSSFPSKSSYNLQSVECKDESNNTVASQYDSVTWGLYIPSVTSKTICTYTFTTSGVTLTHVNTLTETTLWSNPDGGTTNFAAKTVTLSGDFTQYRYVKICWDKNKSETERKCALFESSQLQLSTSKSTAYFGYKHSEFGSTRVRALTMKSNTSIYISNAYTMQQAEQSGSSAYIIPIYIYGLK